MKKKVWIVEEWQTLKLFYEVAGRSRAEAERRFLEGRYLGESFGDEVLESEIKRVEERKEA